MEHRHTQHVAASPDRVFCALANVKNLPRYVPQLTSVQPAEGDTISIEARYEGHTQQGEAWFRSDEGSRRIEWGAPGTDYQGSIEISQDGDGSMLTLSLTTSRGEVPDAELMGTLDALRRLVEADA